MPRAARDVTPVPPFANGNVPVTLVARFTYVVDVDPVPPLAIGKVPVTPVVSGSPVQLVKVPEEGVPKTGVVSVGLVDKTTLPEPVEVVTPVPPLATGKVPVTPVVKGNPVQLVKVPEDGVPKTGVVSVGLVSVLLVSVSVPAKVAKVPVVGRVTVVVLVAVRVVANAPEVVRLPPSVIVLLVLATPVPPFAPSNTPETSDVLISIASQLVFVPSDFKYLPLALVCAGTSALNAALAVICPVPPLAIASVPVKPWALTS